MSKVYPGWKADLLALVNKNNGLSLTEADVKFDTFIPAEHPEACKVTIKPADKSPYFSEQSLVYVRRDLAKAFAGVPLRFIVGADVTIRNVVENIASTYGINFDLAVDFLEADLAKTVDFTTGGQQEVTLSPAETSYVWAGNLKVMVVNDKLDLITIIKKTDLTELHYYQETDKTKGSLMMATTGALSDLSEPYIDMSVGRVIPITFYERVLDVMVENEEITADDKKAAMKLLETDENRSVTFQQYGRAQLAATEKADWTIGSLYGKFVVAYYTDNAGKYVLKTNGGTVTLDLDGWEGISVDWGDGQKETLEGTTTKATHTYADTNEYTVTATGRVKDINGEQTIRGDITEIVNWDNGMASSPSTSNCNSLAKVPNRIPERWTALRKLFQYTNAINDTNIEQWDTSRIVDMSQCFNNCGKMNLDLSRWDVSSVKDMNNMFCACYEFEGKGLDTWDVSKVEDMSYMFYSITSKKFGSTIVNWKTTSLTNARSMFSNTKFNSDISGWDVSKVTDMTSMFAYTDLFNQNIAKWNIGSLRKVDLMFRGAKVFNQDLSKWDVSKITSGLDTIGKDAAVWKEEFRPGYKASA